MDIPMDGAGDKGDARYASIIRAMAEGVVVQDADAVILACNEAAEHLLGLTADQMTGRSSLDPRWHAIHEDGSPFPGDTHPVPVTLRTGEALREVVMGVHKPDGTLTWLSINTEPLFHAGQPAPFAAVCTFNDITRRKRAEDDLRRSEERYRRMVETTLEGVWKIDLQGNTTFANRRMADMLGCSPDELARSSVWAFLDDADHDSVRKALAADARGTGEIHDVRFRRTDGTYLEASIAMSPITAADGQSGALAMVRDVAVERRMQTELRESKQQLELALDVGQMGTWEWNLETDTAKASPLVREILGLPADAPLVAPAEFWASVHPEDLPALRASSATYLASGTRGRFMNTFRVVRPGGAVRWVRSAGGIVSCPTGERRILATLVDVTESRVLEEQLQQAQQMESIGRLAGGVAHDFNNLLTAILASVAFAEREHSPGIAEELQTIRTAAERGAELTRQLLAFARKQVMQLVDLDLNEIIRKLTSVLRRLVGEDVTLDICLADDLWPIRAAASQLEQVIVNLAVNARDAMPRGGPLRISTSNLVLSSTAPDTAVAGIRPGDYVLLSVTDRGLGIDAKALPHIFEPFFSTKQTGTGLGLASSYGIVQQLGGHIRVQSEVSAGTTFTVYLPREGDAITAPVPTPARIRVARRATMTVLLVEDDDLLRGVIERGLVEAGFQVLVSTDGQDALDLAARHAGPIDVLVTDVIMPRVSGRELAAQFMTTRPATKILFTSGYTDEIIARHGVLEPGRHFLAKPYTVDVLAQRIDELLA